MTDAPNDKTGQGSRHTKLSAEAMAKHIAHEHGRSPLADNLKEIVYGGLDGIITTFAVVSGFSGAALLSNSSRWTVSSYSCSGLCSIS